jgi:hypothetical protein
MMETCKQYKEWIWLNIYKELSSDQQKKLTAHIEKCPDCQLDLKEAKQIVNMLHQKIQIEPTDLQLQNDRNELHQRLLTLKNPQAQKNWASKLWQILSLDLQPPWRLATATALFAIGLLLGKLFFKADASALKLDQQLSQLIESNISNIESIRYDSESKQVSITLNTLNDVTIKGDVEKPEIQRLLAQALIAEDRPNMRLKTVRALEKTTAIDGSLLNTLSDVISKEDNPGIRLRAIKLLTSIPITPSIKEILAQILTRVLLTDSNSAIRIEAFKGLSQMKNGSVSPIIFNAAKNDSSDYIRSRARQILERTENPTFPEK